MSERENATRVIATALAESGLQYTVLNDHEYAVNLPGEQRLKTACVFTVGTQAVTIEAFVMRHPDENHLHVYEFLLQHNARMYGVSWSIDGAGDIYLTGRVSLASITPDEVDRIMGCVLEYADLHFNALLKLGFGSSIRREWDWRVERGESLANLAAFADFAQRDSAQRRSAQRDRQ